MSDEKKIRVLKGGKKKREEKMQYTEQELILKEELKKLDYKFFRIDEMMANIADEKDKDDPCIYDYENAYAMVAVSAFKKLEQLLDTYFEVEDRETYIGELMDNEE